MHLFTLELTRFLFPKALDKDKSDFRFVVDVRYRLEGAQFASEQVVMPGLDSYWDGQDPNNQNYARNDDFKPGPDDPKDVCAFDLEAKVDSEVEPKVDPWDKIIIQVAAEQLHSITFKVLDVHTKGFWDKLKDAVVPVAQLLGVGGSKLLRSALPVPATLSNSVGGAVEELQSSLFKGLSGAKDELLFSKTRMLFGTTECGVSGENQVAGKGLKGNYLIRFKWDVSSDPDLAIERGALLDRQDIDRITTSLQDALKKALPDFPGDDYLIDKAVGKAVNDMVGMVQSKLPAGMVRALKTAEDGISDEQADAVRDRIIDFLNDKIDIILLSKEQEEELIGRFVDKLIQGMKRHTSIHE